MGEGRRGDMGTRTRRDEGCKWRGPRESLTTGAKERGSERDLGGNRENKEKSRERNRETEKQREKEKERERERKRKREQEREDAAFTCLFLTCHNLSILSSSTLFVVCFLQAPCAPVPVYLTSHSSRLTVHKLNQMQTEKIAKRVMRGASTEGQAACFSKCSSENAENSVPADNVQV